MGHDPRIWKFVKDMNLDGTITISDVIKWVGWLFFYPGDFLIKLLINKTPGLARFLELSYNDYGGIFSAIISTISWLILFIFFFIILSSILNTVSKIKNKFFPKQ